MTIVKKSIEGSVTSKLVLRLELKLNISHHFWTEVLNRFSETLCLNVSLHDQYDVKFVVLFSLMLQFHFPNLTKLVVNCA